MKKKTPQPSRDRNALLRLRADRDYLHKQILNLQIQLNDQLGFAIALEILARPTGETLAGEVPIREALSKALHVHVTNLRNCKEGAIGRLLAELT
jgi:hypothetical protein